MLRIRDVYPGSRILIFTHPGSRIPDPKTVPKERDGKFFCYHTFFCSHKFHKIKYYVIFETLKKKIWANFQRIVEVFTQKIFNMLSNIWVWDPGSRGQKGTGSRIRIRNTAGMAHELTEKGKLESQCRSTCKFTKEYKVVKWHLPEWVWLSVEL